ncbi:MAG TPA: hypothetical protein VII60_03920 [Acidimicrobiales bacterium]
MDDVDVDVEVDDGVAAGVELASVDAAGAGVVVLVAGAVDFTVLRLSFL